MSMSEDGGTVSYRVKDLLDQINSKLDLALLTLEKKADHEVVRNLTIRVTALEVKDSIEADRQVQSAGAFSKREKFLGMFLAICAIAVPAIIQYTH